jgi:hypothetical protein
VQLTADERRLQEIREKFAAVGTRDDFNLAERRQALARLEQVLVQRVAERRLVAG